MYSPHIQKLIDLFSKFPTVGPRTAARFAFYLIKLPKDKFEELIDSLKELQDKTKLCPSCFNPFDPSSTSEQLCPICQDKSRDRKLLCVVEKEADLNSIENTKKYKGLYFILGGTINLRKEKNIRINELKEKIKNSHFEEIIIATNPTPEGETTALFLERELKGFNVKLTRLGRGLPVGGELEYADPDTLESSFQTRK
jgi:recombination protein RecR